MGSCISMGSEAKCSITVSVTCVYTVTVDSVFLLQDPLLDKLAEHEGAAPEKIAKFCDALSGHDKSRVWDLMKTKVTAEGVKRYKSGTRRATGGGPEEKEFVSSSVG